MKSFVITATNRTFFRQFIVFLVFAWVSWNFRLLAIAFSQVPLAEKLHHLEFEVVNSHLALAGNLLLAPVFLAAAILFFYWLMAVFLSKTLLRWQSKPESKADSQKEELLKELEHFRNLSNIQKAEIATLSKQVNHIGSQIFLPEELDLLLFIDQNPEQTDIHNIRRLCGLMPAKTDYLLSELTRRGCIDRQYIPDRDDFAYILTNAGKTLLLTCQLPRPEKPEN